MKKKITAIMLTLTAIGLVCLTGCTNTGYQPSSNENYYEIDGVYRVIKLKNSEPEKIEKFPLHSYMPRINGDVFETFTATVDCGLTANDILFQDGSAINRKGVEQAYKLIGVENKSAITNELTHGSLTGLYTYNEWSKKSNSGYTFRPADYEKGAVVGMRGNVKVYTITYEDRSKTDGTKVAEGEYQVILIDGAPWIDIFVI